MAEKTSVIIINQNGKENKVIQVPTAILFNWKKYLLVFNTIIALLLVIIGFFIYQKTSDHYKAKLAKANKIRSMIDLKKVKESFISIDKAIYDINKSLESKGLEKLKLENAGGMIEKFDIVDINDMATFYEERIEKVKETIAKAPVGVPSRGEMTSGFGFRGNPFGYNTGAERHSGIDFRGGIGDPVTSTANGTVEFAGPKGGYGNCIIIIHDKNIKTLYAHLSKINVRAEQQIAVGQKIGEIGSTGRSTGPHLHYEIMIDEVKINPRSFLNL